jgi:NTE family protein
VPVQPTGQNREQPPSLPMATVFERMRAIGAAATSAADLRRAMGAFGLESDSILGPGAGQRRAMVAARAGFAQGKQEATRVTFR